MPYAAASGYTYDAADCPRLFETALQAADEPGFAARRAASEAARQAARPRPLLPSARHRRHRRRACRGRRSSPTGWWRSLGTQSQGQGHETVFAQILSPALGVPVERIEIRQGDTRSIPHGGGTGGSSSTIISGTTLKRAADVVIQRGRDLAAERLETAPADIAYRDGAFEVVGTDRRIGLFELAAWKPFDGDAVFADKIESFPTGVMVCEVEVDPETGATRIDRFIAVADCGVVVNPRLLAGQMHGGIVHGLGNALMEEAVYDEETGQLLSGTLMDYALPRADDVPDLRVETIVTPSPNNFLGLEGRRRAADQRRAGGPRQRHARCAAPAGRAPYRHADHRPQDLEGAEPMTRWIRRSALALARTHRRGGRRHCRRHRFRFADRAAGAGGRQHHPRNRAMELRRAAQGAERQGA